ncbi:hypothetical protein ACLCDV_08170 [Sphingobacterium sp. Lzh-3]|uniref:hypothetical protein n=1 Tax=Sphingobacterium sp. Lzh-3 TaxID=3382150 RepID=UPI00398D5963
MDRYIVQSWVCDYGVWDIDNRKFIGYPIDSFRDANIICSWFNTVNFEGKESKGNG